MVAVARQSDPQLIVLLFREDEARGVFTKNPDQRGGVQEGYCAINLPTLG
jgi:hypothetical protein